MTKDSECELDNDPTNYKWNNRNNKDCEWVGKKKTRKRCRKKDKILDGNVFEYCPITCGEVGKGPCSR